MIVKNGDFARLSDGRLIKVTSAVEQDHPHVLQNPDDLFMGYIVKYSTVSNKHFYPRDRKLVINPMSEVVAIETGIVVE